MIKKRFFSVAAAILLILALFLPETTFAQERSRLKDKLRIPGSHQVQILSLKDGSSFIGRIVEVDEDEVQFQSELGVLTISVSKIKDIREVPAFSIKEGKYWFPNPNATRLYFSPTGRMLNKGEGYLADYYLFFPMAAYGITDNISIGGGISIFPGVDIGDQIFYFTPRVGVKASNKLNLSAGALVVKLPDIFDEEEDTSETVGILYGVGTFGTPDLSFTAGLGYGFVGGDFAEKPMVMVGAEWRLSRRTSFITENWVFPGVDEPLVSYGMRFMGEKLSIDFGFINFLGDSALFPGVPYIDFVFYF